MCCSAGGGGEKCSLDEELQLCQPRAQLRWGRDDISYHHRHPCLSLPLRLSLHEALAAPEQCLSLAKGRYLLWTQIECVFSQKLAARVDIPPTGLLLVLEQMDVMSVAWCKKLDGWLLLSFCQNTKSTYSESYHLLVALNPWQVFSHFSHKCENLFTSLSPHLDYSPLRKKSIYATVCAQYLGMCHFIDSCHL